MTMLNARIVLGLESSCDETAVAVLRDGGVAANRIYSQKEHALFGGVVPEIASRAHIQKIDRLCQSVLSQLGLSVSDIDLVAVTDSPGLAGALLVGISFALGLHTGYGLPITGVNHLAGHMASVTLENDIAFPFLALVVSGGHTALYRVDDFGSYRCLGQTIDDAAGEAFDKVGKLLGFSYPAGRAIETEAARHNSAERIPFPVARVSAAGFDFSFSGLKTAVKYHLSRHDEAYAARNKPLVCHSFQAAVIESLVATTRTASQQTGLERIALVGGVACNQALRAALRLAFADNVYFSSPSLCTDNAAMIAKAGYEHCRRGLMRAPRMAPSGAAVQGAPAA